MMKKTRLAALFMCLIGLIFALTGVACATNDEKEEWSFTANVPVACEEGDTVSITLNVENVTGWTATYEVTKNGESVAVSENGEFTPTATGEYVIKVVVTYKGENQEKTYKLNVIKDATAPVVTSTITDKTAAKGEYNFAEDLASIVATDNKTAAENLKKSIVSVTLDGVALTVTENVCTFERAGEYNVSYKVEDEEGNSVPLSYTITVNGLYLNEKAFASETFQLAEYEIASVRAFGYENATVNVELTQDGETQTVEQGAKVKFLKTTDVTLKYTLVSGEEEKDVIEKTVTVKTLDLLLSETDFKVTEGDEITVPTATLSNQTEGVTVTVKVSGQYQEEKEVAQGEKLTAASGVTEITFTAKNADGTFELSRTATVVAIGKDEIVSFEKDGADNPDFNVPAWGQRMGNEELNDNPTYVKSGKYSAKLTFGPNRANQNTYAAGFCYWENQVKAVNVEGANGLSMWIYCEKKEAYIVASIATGSGAKYSGARISHVIKLAKGWNEVNINFDYQVYNAGEKTVNGNKVSLDIKNGISELCFYRVKKGAYTNWDSVNGGNVTDYIYDNALSVYLDEVRAKKLELPDGVYFTFDSKPASTGAFNGKATVVAPKMLVTEGVTLTAKITAPDGTVTAAAIGDEFSLTQSGRYIITYKAEKEGKSSQEISFEVLVPAEGEFLSFETVNGATPDISGAVGEVTINKDAQYVNSGSQSAKLTTVLNQWGNCVAGVCHYEDSRHMPNIEGATGITFWLYSENALYLYTTIGTGAGSEYVSAQAKPIAVKAGWNFITIDFRYDMATSGADINKGICELYFGTGDTANGRGTTPATFYLDSVCFAKLELPDGVYFTFDSKPASTGTINGKATVVAPRMLVTEGVTLTAKITAPDGTVTDAAIGDEFTLTQSGRYIISYKAEKEGKPSQEIEFEVLVPAVGEFLSFETVNGATPDIAGALGEVTINTDAQYVKSGSQSAKLTTVLNEWGNCVAGVCHYEDSRHMPNIEGATGITFWLYSENALYLYTTIGTGAGSEYVSAQAKPIAVKAGWNFITIDFRYDMATSGADISKGICELFFGTGDTANGKGTTPATFYLDSVCFAALPERVVENLAIDFTNISLPADKEFGNVELCTDEQYTKNGKPSLMLEMTANEAENKNMRACYSSWGKGIMLTSGENAVKFEVYASRAGFVSFEFGTGGNAGGGAYGGVKFAKVIELQQGWNTVTITFDATGASGDVNGAVLADGIVHFGATAVKSLDSAVVGNDHYADVATEPLTLYVSTMYAIKA